MNIYNMHIYIYIYTPLRMDMKFVLTELDSQTPKDRSGFETLDTRVSFLSIVFGAGGASMKKSSLSPAPPAKIR